MSYVTLRSHDSKIMAKVLHYIWGPSQKEGPGVLATVLPLADKGLIFGANGHVWGVRKPRMVPWASSYRHMI